MCSTRIRLGVPACTLLLGLAAGAMAGQGNAAMPDTFSSAMQAAMARMDRGMMVPASGDADRDFAAMMIPHHQGAVEMAEAQLRFGRDSVLRRLAQGIIVEQTQEIAVMRQALAALPPTPPSDLPTHPMPTHPMPTHKGH